MISVKNGYVNWVIIKSAGGCRRLNGSEKIGNDYHLVSKHALYELEFFLDDPDQVIGEIVFLSHGLEATCGPSRAFVATRGGS